MWLWWVVIPKEDLADAFQSCLLLKVVCWWKLPIDGSCLLMEFVYWWRLFIDESCHFMKVVNWWKLSFHEICQLMKVVLWWKLYIAESCLLMKIVYWWKLSIDGSFEVSRFLTSEISKFSWVSPVAVYVLPVSDIQSHTLEKEKGSLSKIVARLSERIN